MVAAPALIGCDEFPVGYSLAGCPPAEPASASPTGDDSQQSTLPYNDFSANGNYPLNFVSQSKGALQKDMVPDTPPLSEIRLDRGLIPALPQINSSQLNSFTSRSGVHSVDGARGRRVDGWILSWWRSGRVAPCGVWVGQGECVRARAF